MLKIIKDNKPSLRERSIPLELPYSNNDIKLLLEMHEYIKKSQDDEYAAKKHIRSGVGLAAPQIGVNKRMIAIYYYDGEKEVSHALINPKIVSSSVKMCYLNCGEGCLSVDEEHKGYVYRPYKITVKAYDAILKHDVTIIARGYEAIVLQHEIDHLNGILFYDHIDPKKPFEKKDNSVEI